jgi:penicillin-binding protein-related factor A (putative recombinase)
LQVQENKQQGDEFERLFEKQARFSGLLCEKNYLTAKFIGHKRHPLVTKSELDYKLISQTGEVGYFDCKSFSQNHFTYSKIDSDQIKRAVKYNDWCVPSGFVILFKKQNQIIFFSGHEIARKGAGARFSPEEGLLLGGLMDFDLKRLVCRKKPLFPKPYVSILSVNP